MHEKFANRPSASSQKESLRTSLATSVTEQEGVASLVPLHASVHWFLNIWKPLNPHYRNCSALFKVSAHLDLALLEKTMHYLCRYHDVLRSRFFQENDEWHQLILEPSTSAAVVSGIDLSAITETERKATLEALVLEFQASLHLTTGPLFRIAYMDLGSLNPGRLLFIFHHMIVDGYSVEMLLGDFMVVYMQLSQGEPIHLPPKSAPFKQWTERLHNYAQSPERYQEMEYWLSLPWEKCVPFPLDYPYIQQTDTIASSASVESVLSHAETARLLKCSRAKFKLIHILLTALVQTFTQWAGSPLLHVGVVNHARLLFEELDISRTVGFFALCQDILLEPSENCTVMEAVQSIKTQLDSMPSKGFGKEILSCLSNDPYIIEKIQSIPRRQILFNYLGRRFHRNSSSSFSLEAAEEAIGPDQDSRNNRLELVYCSCAIVQDQFYFSIEYSENVHLRTTMKTLSQSFIENIQNSSKEIY